MCRSRNCQHNSTTAFFSFYGIEELDKQRHIQFRVDAKLQIENGDGWISFISTFAAICSTLSRTKIVGFGNPCMTTKPEIY